MSTNRRKKKLVNLSVQGAVALRIIAHSLLFVWSVLLVCGGLLYINGELTNSEDFTRIRGICLMAIGISSLAILPAIIYDSIRFSHRIAGPIVRLKNLLPRIGIEQIEHVGLRKNDFWREMAADFNAMLDRVEALRQAAEANGTPTGALRIAEEPEETLAGTT